MIPGARSQSSDHEDRGRHLLLIAFYFPPSRASGVFRARAIAREFVRQGWWVTVMTCQREFFTDSIRAFDTSLESTIPETVSIERVRFPARSWEPDIRNYSWMRAHFPSLANAVYRRYENLVFPERYASWIPPAILRGLAVHRRKPIDLVIATGNPFSNFEVARWIGRLCGVPYIADYRDSWTLNQFTEAPAFPADHDVWPAESRIIRKAARITFVNEPQRDYYSSLYPDSASKMLVVENGFDEDVMGFSGIPERTAVEGRPTFGYLGTITEQLPLQIFMEGWAKARAEGGPIDESRLIFYGHLGFFPNHAKQILPLLMLDHGLGVEYRGPVGKIEVRATYEELDILLALIPSSKFVTAGKVYEYMATGKPILAVFDHSTHSASILRQYSRAVLIDELTPDSIADGLRLVVGFLEGGESADRDRALEFARRFSRSKMLKPLIDAADAVTQSG